jgi:hypothetical protein
MAAQLSPVLGEGGVWRVKIVWPNRAVHFVGKFTSERDAIDWVNAHRHLGEPVAIKREPLDADRSC